MRSIMAALIALLLVGLGACASTTADRLHWRPGNSKFTTGLNAPVPNVEEPHR